MRWNDNKNVDKFRLSWSVVPKSQSITRFDCRAAVCLLYDVKECLWIQEAIGEVWISLERNVIDIAVNEWRNRLHVYDCTIGQHFDQFHCSSRKKTQLEKSVSQIVKNVNKMCSVRK